jgi:hypothetical protein
LPTVSSNLTSALVALSGLGIGVGDNIKKASRPLLYIASSTL